MWTIKIITWNMFDLRNAIKQNLINWKLKIIQNQS
jgi:hypothetical protein